MNKFLVGFDSRGRAFAKDVSTLEQLKSALIVYSIEVGCIAFRDMNYVFSLDNEADVLQYFQGDIGGTDQASIIESELPDSLDVLKVKIKEDCQSIIDDYKFSLKNALTEYREDSKHVAFLKGQIEEYENLLYNLSN